MDADARYAAWMRDNLHRAALHFGVNLVGEPILGWRSRSVGAPVTGPDGELWLRVVSQEPQWARGDHWTGTVDANVVEDVTKPVVLAVHEWTEGRHQRAELANRVPGTPCSPTDVLRGPIPLTGRWWDDLDRALSAVKAAGTTRVHAVQHAVADRIHGRFGTTVDATVTQWQTVHGDLHWSNIMCPDFALLDWELWGVGPAWLDEATLYCFSLLVPDLAAHTRARFAHGLDTPAGQLALLYTSARLLRRAEHGDFPDLAAPLRSLAHNLIHR